jgi:hypothetical protein
MGHRKQTSQALSSVEMREQFPATDTFQELKDWTEMRLAQQADLLEGQTSDLPNLVYIKYGDNYHSYPKEYADFIQRMKETTTDSWIKKQLEDFTILKEKVKYPTPYKKVANG